MRNGQYEPGPELYRRLKAAFVHRGTSLARWCKENGQTYTTVRNAVLIDVSRSKAARERREKACRAAGL